MHNDPHDSNTESLIFIIGESYVLQVFSSGFGVALCFTNIVNM